VLTAPSGLAAPLLLGRAPADERPGGASGRRVKLDPGGFGDAWSQPLAGLANSRSDWSHPREGGRILPLGDQTVGTDERADDASAGAVPSTQRRRPAVIAQPSSI